MVVLFIIVALLNLNIKYITSKMGNDEMKHVKIIEPLKFLGNFWKTLEIPLINCEINLI